MNAAHTTSLAALGHRAATEADRCVMCGLCLPHCPTYRLNHDENESPRGRISLIRAVTDGVLPMDRKIASHLSRCLGCRACERACPSGVHYGQLIDTGRMATAATFGISMKQRLALSLLESGTMLNMLGSVFRALQRTGLRKWLRTSGLLRRLGLERHDRLLPDETPASRLAESYSPHDLRRGRIALFTGCITREADAKTIEAAIRVLTRYGYEVWLPTDQACCGGLHREAGALAGAERLRTRNRQAFGEDESMPIITLASGCGAALQASTTNDAGDLFFSRRVQDIHAFLSALELPSHLTLMPCNEQVAVHDPCSLRNGLRSEQAVYRLLGQIPQLQVESLPGNSLCCGGAGGYVFREPEIADRLRAPKLDQLLRHRPDRVVSANLGCALHLSAGLHERGIKLTVEHPLVLFDRQLRRLNPEA